MNMKRTGTTALLLAVAIMAIGLGACRSTQPAKVQFDDSAITTAVKASFIADPIVKVLEVNVTTNEGVVVLTGRVKTAGESAQAEKLARNTNGVKGVRNMIKVGPMPANPNNG